MQVKAAEKDGYNAVQLGYEDIKPSRRKKPQTGHAEKADTEPKKFVKEMKLPDGAVAVVVTGEQGGYIFPVNIIGRVTKVDSIYPYVDGRTIGRNGVGLGSQHPAPVYKITTGNGATLPGCIDSPKRID